MCAQGQGFHGFRQAIVEIEVDRVEIQLAGFDLGKVQNVIDQTQQRISGGFDSLQVLALLGGELGVQCQLRHSQHTVHGRTDLVAHVGQELAFGAAGRFGSLLCGLQLRVCAPEFFGPGCHFVF